MANLIATRSSLQNQSIINFFKGSSLNVIDYPFIEIEPIFSTPEIKKIIDDMHLFSKIIFISSNAAQCFKIISEHHSIKFSDNVQIFAIGPTTKKELSFLNKNIFSPIDQFDSKTLLGLPEIQNVTDESILIVRGVGGKELLKNELEKKQANITYLECYQRIFKLIDFNVIANYSQKETLYILITSSQIAQHFIDQLGLFENPDQIHFDHIHFIVNHENIAKELSVFECDIKITPTLDPEKLQSLCID